MTERDDTVPIGLPADAINRLRNLHETEDQLYTSDLSVNEFLLVREAGFQPLGMVLGTSIYHVGVVNQSLNVSAELPTLSHAMYEAREFAMARMTAEANELGADGIVGVRLDIEFKDFGNDIAEFIAVGTAIKAEQPPPNGSWRPNTNLPFTSDLSGQDFWTMLQAGFAPLGLVLGSCVYHLARRPLGQTANTIRKNKELENFTQALYDAREIAMGRMQFEASRLNASGIIGVKSLSLQHKWGTHTTEFFALGTAVRSLRDDHQIATPQLILPLND